MVPLQVHNSNQIRLHLNDNNFDIKFYKIVQRFYKTLEGLSSGYNMRKAKIPIPAAPKAGFTLHFNKLRGIRNLKNKNHYNEQKKM
jgi:hypothetical protein